jgi:rSAM/selenodomain-associated transferase 1
VFLKAPRIGFAKTRLARGIGPRRALSLYRAFARDQLEWLAGFPCAERQIQFTPRSGRKACLALLPPGGRGAFRAVPQAGGDLGRRLRAAFAAAFRGGARRVVAVGTDAPLLSPGILARAFRCLARKDLVLGPARDGGYYLIGLGRHVPRLFRSIPWSSGKVLAATLARAREAGLAAAILPALGDIDSAADVAALREDLRRARRTGAYLPRRTARAIAEASTALRSPCSRPLRWRPRALTLRSLGSGETPGRGHPG